MNLSSSIPRIRPEGVGGVVHIGFNRRKYTISEDLNMLKAGHSDLGCVPPRPPPPPPWGYEPAMMSCHEKVKTYVYLSLYIMAYV